MAAGSCPCWENQVKNWRSRSQSYFKNYSRMFTSKMCCCWCRGSAHQYDCLRFLLVINSAPL